jgi:hypothetical protein
MNQPLDVFLTLNREKIQSLPRDGAAYICESFSFANPSFTRYTKDTVLKAFDPDCVFTRALVNQMQSVEGSRSLVVGIMQTEQGMRVPRAAILKS